MVDLYPLAPLPFLDSKVRFFLKGKMALYTELYTQYPKPFLDYNVNFYNGQISSEKGWTLCSKKGPKKGGKKRSGFFGYSATLLDFSPRKI